jgi:hypothetical protein
MTTAKKIKQQMIKIKAPFFWFFIKIKFFWQVKLEKADWFINLDFLLSVNPKFRKQEGLTPVNWLNALQKLIREPNPGSGAMASIVQFL